MRFVTTDDIIETYCKIHQRGLDFVVSKFHLNNSKRTKSAFDNSSVHSSNWWIIPKVRKRWNYLITGDENMVYEDYVLQKHLQGKSNLKMLSLGSGVCSHEIYFAQHPVFSEIKCVDFAANLLEKAKKKSDELKLTNMSFATEDVYKLRLEDDYYDIVLFHSSLHHFANIETLLRTRIIPTLKKGGLVIINEYVGPNRLQYPNSQLKAINEALKLIPTSYKKRFKMDLAKRSTSGPGLLRMIVADPSECVESENIVPTLNTLFDKVEERPFGGNILMPLFKDIAHHFLQDDPITNDLIQRLFALEDAHLKTNTSHFLFGVYRKR